MDISTIQEVEPDEAISASDGVLSESLPSRFSVSLPPMQDEALRSMSAYTKLSKNDLIRHAVALLNVSVSARRKGLRLALINNKDEVVGHIVSTV